MFFLVMNLQSDQTYEMEMSEGGGMKRMMDGGERQRDQSGLSVFEVRTPVAVKRM
jgi:hypothetical protein